MKHSALDLEFGLAPFSFGAHLDYSHVPCEGCDVIHDVVGFSLGLVFVRMFFVLRIGCDSDE